MPGPLLLIKPVLMTVVRVAACKVECFLHSVMGLSPSLNLPVFNFCADLSSKSHGTVKMNDFDSDVFRLYVLLYKSAQEKKLLKISNSTKSPKFVPCSLCQLKRGKLVDLKYYLRALGVGRSVTAALALFEQAPDPGSNETKTTSRRQPKVSSLPFSPYANFLFYLLVRLVSSSSVQLPLPDPVP